MPEMKNFYSSHVQAAGYDVDKGELHIDWQNGTRTIYMSVPPDLANEVLAAPSIGEALYRGIKGKFSYFTVRQDE